MSCGRPGADAPIADARQKEKLRSLGGPSGSPFFLTPGPHYVIAVDSSWGAGRHGASYGGMRRDTWIYDESTKKWAWMDPHVSPPTFTVNDDGPSDDRFHGAYRARSEGSGAPRGRT